MPNCDVGWSETRWEGNVWPVHETGQYWSFGSLIASTIRSTNLGTKPSGMTTVPQIFTIRNSGSQSVTIGSLFFTGLDASQFSVTPGGSAPCDLAAPLAAGSACTVSVTATPTSSGVKVGALTITSGGQTSYIPVTVNAIATVIGIISDQSTGLPVSGATITLTPGSTAIQSASDGSFSFTALSAGTYSISITKTGYQTITKGSLVVSNTASAFASILLPISGDLNITTNQLPSATVGTAYSSRVMVAGGTAPYSFKKNYGTLPDGLTLDTATGIISGTPTGSGGLPFDILVTDQTGSFSDTEFTIDLVPLMSIPTLSLPRGTVGIPYTAVISASGGKPAYTFSASTGLPVGISLSADGTLSGTPTASGPATVTVTATDATGRAISRQFSQGVDQPLVITTTRLNSGLLNSAFTQQLAVTGGYGTLNWSLYAGTLPKGLSFDQTSGTLSGTPTEALSRYLTFAVQDSNGRTTYANLPLTVADQPTFTFTSLPNASSGNPYSEKVRVTGGIPPYQFSMTGTLPTGLSFNSATGIVSGTSTPPGSKNMTFTVTDSSYPTPLSVSKSLSLRVSSNVTATTSAVLPNARIGTAIAPITLNAKGGNSPYTWSIVGGALPDGLSLNGTTGIINGTPAVVGEFSVIIHTTDKNGNTTGTDAVLNPDKTFYLHVSDVLAITTATLPTGAAGLPYTALLNVSGGFAPYNWNVTSGTLPTGIVSTSTGNPCIISGTPTASSSNALTLQVTDSDTTPQSAQKNYTLTVSSVLSIFETTLPDARIGQPYSANIRAQAGLAPYSWRITAGSLPDGITMQQTATGITLSGTPTTASAATFTLEVSDSAADRQTVSRQFTLSVLPAIAITTTTLATVPKGNPYSQFITVTGGHAPYQYSVSAGSLLQGLAINSASGEIGGILAPTAGQSSSVTIRVTDSGNPTSAVEKQFTIVAAGGVSVAGSVLSGAATGTNICTGPATAGGSATCILTPANGYVLKQLTDNNADVLSSVANGSYTIASVTADRSIVASFALATPATLAVQKSLAAAGTVTSIPAGIFCDAASAGASASFNEGTKVSLTAQANHGYYFVNWNNCASANSNQCIVTMAQGLPTITATFSAMKATGLSINPKSQNILLNDNVTLSGQLSILQGSSSTELNSQPINISVQAPSGAILAYNSSTVDNNGHWSITLTGFNAKGTYFVRAAYAGSQSLMDSQSDTAAVLVEKTAGYAIIVQGKITSNEGLADHRYTTDNIVQKLTGRSFLADNVLYLTSSETAAPTKAQIQSAITTWAKDKMNGLPSPFYLIMVDHGDPGEFHIGSDSVTPQDLNGWLTTLEAGLTAAAAAESRTIVIGACYSGSFIPALSKSGRTIITSAAATEQSIRGQQIPTSTPGVFVRSGEYFLDELFNGLARGKNVDDAFTAARDLVKAKDVRKVPMGLHSGVFDSLAQHPLLDDNGDTAGSYNPVGSDGKVAALQFLGEGAVLTNAVDSPGDIKKTTSTIYLTSSQNSALLWLNASLDSRVDAAWVEIRRPDTSVTGDGGSGQVIINNDTVNLIYNSTTSRWEGTYSSFDTPGAYEIYYYTHDNQTGDISPMVTSTVYRDKAGNQAPTAFDLTAPNGSTEKTFLSVSWQESSDPDGLTYTLEVSKDQTFATVDYLQEGISDVLAVIPDGNLQDLSTYYWRVTAVDQFGEKTKSNQTYSFNTYNTNGLPGIIKGYLRDSVSGAAIAGGTITVGNSKVTTLSNGVFLMIAQPGSYTITAAATGYQQVNTSLIVIAGKIASSDFALQASVIGQSISFGAAPTIVVGGTGTITATGGDSGNVVIFNSTTQNICTVSPSNIVTGVAAGTCTITADQAGSGNYTAAPQKSLSITINKATATITLGALNQSYTGTAGTVTATTTPAGLTTSITYNGNTTAPTAAGNYPVVATINDNNYQGSTTGTLVIAKAAPTISWPTPTAVYVGTALSATQLNASINGVAGTFAYTPTATTVMNTVGNQQLNVTFTPDNANYTTATAGVTLSVINKLIPVITWGTPVAITYGTALTATQLNATTSVAGTFAYTPPLTTVLSAGSQTLSTTFTPTETSTYGTVTTTVTITVNKATATITLGALNQNYTGTASTVTATTTPAGLTTGITYNGTTTAPTAAGSYPVVATINDNNYQGSTTGTLVIAAQAVTYTVSGSISGDGTIQCNAPIESGNVTTCTLTPGTGYRIADVSGCGTGSLNGTTYTTGPITDNCVVLVNFAVQKPGDCDDSGTVTIAEVQSSINMFLGLKEIATCVDLDKNGSVSISEVQKVINSFLAVQ